MFGNKTTLKTLASFAVLSCLALATSPAHAALLTFDSPNPAGNVAARNAWLSAIGIAVPDFLQDFESGFANGQNIHNLSLHPAGLIIRDTDAGSAIIRSGAGVIGGSNPVGTFAVTQNERPFLELDFSAFPVDYVAFQDIDQAGTTGTVFTAAGNAIVFETTAVGGDSAEFFGIFAQNIGAITKVELDASGDGRWGIDNIEYGTIPVPEPGTLAMFGLGLAGLGYIRRRRAA